MKPPRYKLLTARKLRLAAAAKGRDRAAAAKEVGEASISRPVVVLNERPNDDYAGLDWCLGDECR